MNPAVRIMFPRLLCAVVLSALPCARPALAAQAQPPPSIAASFETFWAAAQGKPFAQQEALWNQYIEAPRAALYRSVVWETRDYPNWRRGKAQMLKARFGVYPHIAPEIPTAVKRLKDAIKVEARRFRHFFPGASQHPRVAILLAPDFDSKSGILPDGKPVLALAIDTLILEKANLKILLPHEFFHLYDAEHAGVKNDGVMPDTHITLPLYAEGLATYVSSVVSPGYSDGQYLFQKNLGALPDSQLPKAARAFLADADVMTINPEKHRVSRAYKRWFYSSARKLQPGFPDRAGYWLGLHLIRRLRRKYSLLEIASWPPAKAQAEMQTALATMARSSG